MMEMKEKIETSLKKVEKWVESHDYKGYEPFDGLSSFLKPLTCDNLLLERILQQMVRQSPINLRPILGIKPKESTKGRGYMAGGYLTMLKITGDQTYKKKAVECLDWLSKNKAPGYANHSWGNHFDFSSRASKLPKHTPIIVWTSLIGQAFLDAYELLQDQKYLAIAQSICRWILDVPREQTDSGSCLSYIAESQVSIHNSNMLGSAMLARTAKLTKNPSYLDVAREAMRYSCTRQLPDGAWYYGEHPMHHWIDNFHTGYNLDSLKCYIESTYDTTYKENMERGLTYYKSIFFEPSGKPKYYHNRTFPVDSQCASQSIETLSNFTEFDEKLLPQALKVAQWTIKNMQDKKGFFYYRQYFLGVKSKTPMLHWAQATMYKALTAILLKINMQHLKT